MAAIDLNAARDQMIHQQLRAWDVLDQSVLDVVSQVPRPVFVPEGYAELAFADVELPLGHGDRMLAPKVVGRVLQAVAPSPTERVLEIGTGSGFLTACLAATACSVRSLERREDLVAAARRHLATAAVRNATIEYIDAYAEGALGTIAWDVIVLTGSLPLPDARFEQQLAIGGRLFAVIGTGPVMEATLIERLGTEQWRRTVLFETSLKPLIGARAREAFSF
ncbi:MAG: protein-L-isoaspartate O-methyltransferase [Sinobacteraceae bacterium]|nr:protein-L-isoaspartate O-methyltransferase [Nevskiaceae bacterium]